MIDATTTETFASAATTTQRDARTWVSPLHEAYHLWGGTFVHGGFSMAVAVDAMIRACDRPDPVTVTAHFLEQVQLEDARVEVDVLRSGGRHSTVAAQLLQGDATKLRLLGTFGDLAAASGPSHHAVAPDCPPWDHCIGTGFPQGFTRHVEGRLDQSDQPLGHRPTAPADEPDADAALIEFVGATKQQ